MIQKPTIMLKCTKWPSNARKERKTILRAWRKEKQCFRLKMQEMEHLNTTMRTKKLIKKITILTKN